MKIILFDELPISEKLGIVTEWKSLIDKDNLVFKVDRDGDLSIGAHTYKVIDGQALVPQYHILLGNSYKMFFTDSDKKSYYCGVIKRTGSRFIEINNELESALIACVAAFDAQERKYKRLEAELKYLKEKIGITIV